MTAKNDDLIDAIVNTVREHALGPDHSHAATAFPLSAYGGVNDADDWYGTDNTHGKRREGHPIITVQGPYRRGFRNWVATAICSPTGKNTTVYVADDVKVVRVKRS